MNLKLSPLISTGWLRCLFLLFLTTYSFATSPENHFKCNFLPYSLSNANYFGTYYEDNNNIVISYLDSFNYSFHENTTWVIVNITTGELIHKGIGTIQDLIFKEPGNYLLSVFEEISHNEGSCEHQHYPEKINIFVTSEKMDYDFSTLKLSDPIIGDRSVENITLTVDVEFYSFDAAEKIYDQGLKTVGLGTSIIGKLKNGPIMLQQGTNTLVFQLEGQASKNTYISFDFININGQIQSYGLTHKIQ